jgi:hypothetical protein
VAVSLLPLALAAGDSVARARHQEFVSLKDSFIGLPH